MIIIAGTIDLADPAQRDEVIERSLPLQQSTRTEEPGCAAYIFGADPCVPGRIVVYELWDDEPSLAAHFEHPNFHGMRAMLSDYTRAGGQTAKFRCDLTEPVYDPERRPRADFFTA